MILWRWCIAHITKKKDKTETGEFYDYATWGMQRWSGLQGYHYGIYDAECSCKDLPCAMANLFIHIIADFEGKENESWIQVVDGHH